MAHVLQEQIPMMTTTTTSEQGNAERDTSDEEIAAELAAIEREESAREDAMWARHDLSERWSR